MKREDDGDIIGLMRINLDRRIRWLDKGRLCRLYVDPDDEKMKREKKEGI